MKRRRTHGVRVCLFFFLLLATVPAYCQRGNLGIDVGETSDTFGSQAATSAADFNVDGQVSVIKGNNKEGSPSIVAGGEIRIPSDSSSHATEYALFGGPAFHFRDFTIGVDAQVRKIHLPTEVVNGQFLARGDMELLELPIVIKYRFMKSYFVQVSGAPEFTPRWRHSAPATIGLPNPSLDHAYFVRGSVGRNFGKYYVRATYENRYFSFIQNTSNPEGLYNWRSNLVTGGVGLNF